ncbi:RNA cytosine-C(5)-methyltransferase NSUN2 [Lamellibrachia satsuma]|nr:RNA cytosine-C(5)-methyltransferase NSUN2 [Lamellibrachia satsuma]
MTRSGRPRPRRRRNQNKESSTKQQKSGPRDGDNERGYTMTVKENAAFETYYKAQGIVPEDEWEKFMTTLKATLPSTFRITGHGGQAEEMLRIIKSSYLKNLVEVVEGQQITAAPKILPWYPGEMAWQLDFDRKFIRHSATLKKLHQFMISETESGNISRQEAVSMIPPLVMDIKSHHKVLDMCAAPGSKTAQLIELLHADSPDSVPEGVVVANDSDNKRCYLMVHQVKRLESPNFMIINHDASKMPNLRLSPEGEDRKVMKFDRILADVPCSGDGTLRKNPDIWKRWNPNGGHSLHVLQRSILNRGLEMLEVDGRLVYSTCSFNPIEDEAVVASMLDKTKGSVELVDVSAELPGLKYSKGLTTWKVMSKDGDWYDKYEDLPLKLQNQIRPSMFPPPPDVADSQHLNRCVRVLPHFQDTGGFFIAVLKKVKEVPWVTFSHWRTNTTADQTANEEQHAAANHQGPPDVTVDVTADLPPQEGSTCEPEAAAADKNGEEGNDEPTEGSTEGKEGVGEGMEDDSNGDDGGGETQKSDEPKPQKRKWGDRDGSPPPLKKQNLRGYKEDPFVFLEQSEAIWPQIKEFYGFDAAFDVSQLMVRCHTGKKRNIYFVSSLVRTIIKCNTERIRFINLGLKILSRSESKFVNVDFRLAQDGINTVYPFMKKRRVKIAKDDIVTILCQENPFLSKISQGTREQLEQLEQGSVIFIYEPGDSDDGPACKMVICGWLGKTSCRSFLAKFERAHYLRLCGVELKTKEEILAEKTAKNATVATSPDEGDENTEGSEVQPGDTEEKMEGIQTEDTDTNEKSEENGMEDTTEVNGTKVTTDFTGSNVTTEVME